MNYLLVGEFGQVNDNIQHMIEKICPYTDNNFSKIFNTLEVNDKLIRNNNVIIVDYNIGEVNVNGVDFLTKYRRIIENGKQGILICSSDIKDELNSHLTEGYEYWFDIITKPISEEELRKILT